MEKCFWLTTVKIHYCYPLWKKSFRRPCLHPGLVALWYGDCRTLTEFDENCEVFRDLCSGCRLPDRVTPHLPGLLPSRLCRKEMPVRKWTDELYCLKRQQSWAIALFPIKIIRDSMPNATLISNRDLYSVKRISSAGSLLSNCRFSNCCQLFDTFT